MPSYEYAPSKTKSKYKGQKTSMGSGAAYAKNSPYAIPRPTITEQVLPSPTNKAAFDPARPDDPNRSSAGIRSQAADIAAGDTGNAGNGDPMGGFASRYLSGPGTAEMLQRQPEVVLADTMRAMGLSPNGGMYGMVEPSADFANALYMLTNGGELGTNEQMINWMNGYFGNQLTPGAGGIDVRSALGSIFNPQAGGPLESFLNAGQDPRTQVSALRSLVDAGSGYGVPLIMQRALANQMDMLGRDYMSSAARGGMSTGNFNDYIAARKNNMLTPFVGMGQ